MDKSKRPPSKKAVTAARREIRDGERAQRKLQASNSVLTLFDYPRYTLREVIRLVRERYDLENYQIAYAIQDLIKRDHLVVGEDGYIFHNPDKKIL